MAQHGVDANENWQEWGGVLGGLAQFEFMPQQTALVIVDMQYSDASRDYGIGAKAKRLGTEAQFAYYFDRLDSLVNEAIQMARIEAGQVQLDRQPQLVTDLVAGAIRSAGRALQDREVRTDISRDLPEVLADRQLIQAVIRHLIGNSLKYAAPESTIELRAWSEADKVMIAVKDRGPGIPEREQERIFERFYRSPRSATAAPGTGMGLAIARDIVEAHGGTLNVCSHPGQGSEFYFSIPAVPAGVRR